MKVSGQVIAEDKEALVTKEGITTDAALAKHGFPTNVELGAHVLRRKDDKNINIMGEGTEAKPVLEKGHVIKLVLNDSHLAWLPPITIVGSKTAAMGLETSDGEPYAGGFHFVRHKKHILANTMFTLHDMDQNIVAICLEDRSLLNPFKPTAYTIYGVHPRFDGDTPVSSDGVKEECAEIDVTLYNWAHYENHHIKLWTEKKEFELMYKSPRVHMAFGGGQGEGFLIKPEKDTSVKLGAEKNETVLAALHKRKIYNKGLEENYPGWDITIAPGVDPVLMCCLTAVLDVGSGINL